MSLRPLFVLLPCCLLVQPVSAEVLQYQFDNVHSQVHASVDHLGFSSSTARFRVIEGVIEADAADLSAARVSVVLDAAPDLGDATWLEHVSGPKWFDLASHPQIRFESTAVEALGEDRFRISGELSLKGQTQPVTLEAKLNKAGPHPFNNKPRLGFSATASFSRSAFGISEYVPAVGDEVSVRIEVEAGAP